MLLKTPRKLPAQARSRLLVESLLDAAARILAGDGYAAVNTNRVATEAGVSIGSLYQYFGGKEELVAAVVERHGRRIHHAITRAAGDAAPTSLLEAIERAVEAVLAAHRIDPALHGVLEREMPHVDVPDGHAETVRAIRDLLGRLPPAIAAEIRVAGLDRAARVTGEIVHALAHAALIPPVAEALAEEDVAPDAVRAVMAYLTGAPSRETGRPHVHH